MKPNRKQDRKPPKQRNSCAMAGATCSCNARCEVAPAMQINPCSCAKRDCQFCEIKLYAGLPIKQIQKINGDLHHCNCGPRQVLFRAGDPARYLYVIRDGQVKLTRTAVDGHDHLLNLVGTGYFLAFDTIGNSTYSYNAETLTPVVLCRIKHDDILRLLEKEPRVSLNVLLAVNEQLAQSRNMIGALGQKTAMEKVAALLLSLRPPAAVGASGKAGSLHLSRQEMAEILGLTVETVSRIMAGLRRKGIINAPRGRIAISARARLQTLAGEPLRATPSAGKSRPRRKGVSQRERQLLRKPGNSQPVISIR